jgi:hypothetical protein
MSRRNNYRRFNRSFSPHAEKNEKSTSSPMNVVANNERWFYSANVWIHDLKVGGGRIVERLVILLI